MKKHSKASLVGIQFSDHKKSIKVTYKDNGMGFSDTTRFGFGLTNTVSRIQNYKGTFNFTSQQGDGVTAEILVPVK